MEYICISTFISKEGKTYYRNAKIPAWEYDSLYSTEKINFVQNEALLKIDFAMPNFSHLEERNRYVIH